MTKRKNGNYLFDGVGAHYMFEVEVPPEVRLDAIGVRNMFSEAFDVDDWIEVEETKPRTFRIIYETFGNNAIHKFADECSMNGSATINGLTVTLIFSEPI